MSVDPCMLFTDWSMEITAKDAKRVAASAALIPTGTKLLIAALPGEAIEARIAAAKLIKGLGLVPVPHISARRLQSHDELERFLDGLRSEAGVEKVMVVAGDPTKPLGPFVDALSIIRSGLLQKYGIQGVGIAGYPQGHPAIADERIWHAKREKMAALLAQNQEFVLATQFAFDADQILSWISKVRTSGIKARVRIGIPGPSNAQKLLAFASRCGVEASAGVMKKYGLGLSKLLTTSTPEKLIMALVAGLDHKLHGEVMLHFYPFGGIQATTEWIRDFQRRNDCDDARTALSLTRDRAIVGQHQ